MLFKKKENKVEIEEAAQIIEDAKEHTSEMIEQAREKAKEIWKEANTDAQARVGKAYKGMKGEGLEETIYFYRSKWTSHGWWRPRIFASDRDDMNGYLIAVKKVKFIEGEGLVEWNNYEH